ncbi:hypothetical protein GKQ38_05440 [Candidatus Nanohaloarchaea archaeon]|nr:hypothetical protein GKQ38_05440 [Candidatus Nanohaloarchaea archaeon]
MKYRILLILAVLAAASPIAADSINTEASEDNSNRNFSYNETLFLASSGGETVLGSALSQSGALVEAEKFNGTTIRKLEDKGQYLDIEALNQTYLAFVHRDLTKNGVESQLVIRNRNNDNLSRNFSIKTSITDVEKHRGRYVFANSTGIHTIDNTSETLQDLDLPNSSEVTDLEIRDNFTVLSTSNPDQIIIRESGSQQSFNVTGPRDIQIIDTGARISILVAQERRVAEYRVTDGNLTEAWTFTGLESGKAVHRLPNNNTVIADEDQVFAVNRTGHELWSRDMESVSDIEHGSKKAFSLESQEIKEEEPSYWAPDRVNRSKVETGFLEELIRSTFSLLL